jgi:hypothetical protein
MMGYAAFVHTALFSCFPGQLFDVDFYNYCYLWVNPYIPTIRPDEEILELETD